MNDDWFRVKYGPDTMAHKTLNHTIAKSLRMFTGITFFNDVKKY